MATEQTVTTPPEDLAFINDIAADEGVAPQLAFGILGAENGGFGNLTANKTSRADARGLWQLTRGAVKQAGYDPDTFDYNDPVLNTQAAMRYIKYLQDSVANGDPALTAVAYNWGEGNLRKHLEAGGGVETLPDGRNAKGEYDPLNDVQKYLLTTDDYSGGYLSAGEKPAEPEKSAQPTIQPTVVPTPAPTPQSVEPPHGSLFEQLGAIAGPPISGTYNKLIKPAAESFLQFPVDMTQNAIAGTQRAGQAIDSALGIPGTFGPLEASELVPLKPLDPTSAVNFGSAFFPPVARTVSAGISLGETVLNLADGEARQEAQAKGEDWDNLGPIAKASRITEKVDSSLFAENIPALAGSAGMGFIFGGKGKHPDPTDEALEYNRVFSKNEEALGQANLAHRADVYQDSLYNQAQEAARIADQEAADAYARRVAPDLLAKEKASQRLSKLNMPIENASDLQTWAAHQQAREVVASEFNIPPTDPSKPIYQGLLGTPDMPSPTALRELDPMSAENIDKALADIANEARKRNILKGQLEPLGRPLGDDFGNAEKIAQLQDQAARPDIPAIKRANLEAEAELLSDEMRPPTVQDLVDRLQAIDELRRNTEFKKTAGRRVVNFLDKLSEDLRKEGGIAESAFLPDEVIQWRTANSLSKSYNQQIRTLDLMMDHFKDVEPGAHSLRNAMKSGKAERTMRRELGDENYDRLYELSVALDTVRAKLEPPPKPTAEPLRPPRPFKAPELEELPNLDKPTKTHQDSTDASNVMRLVNLALSPMGRAGIAGGIGYSAAANTAKLAGSVLELGHNPAIINGIGMTGAALGMLMASPVMTKAFKQMTEHMAQPTSKQFLQAYSRLLTAGMIQRSYQTSARPPLEAEELRMQTPAPPTESPGPKLPFATRPTGGPIPAPPPTSARLPAGAPPVL